MNKSCITIIVGCLVSSIAYGLDLKVKEAKWIDNPHYKLDENCKLAIKHLPDIYAVFDIIKPPEIKILYWDLRPDQNQLRLTTTDGDPIQTEFISASAPRYVLGADAPLPNTIDSEYEVIFPIENQTQALVSAVLDTNLEMLVANTNETTQIEIPVPAGERVHFNVLNLNCDAFTHDIIPSATLSIVSCDGDINHKIWKMSATNMKDDLVSEDDIHFARGFDPLEPKRIVAYKYMRRNNWKSENLKINVTFLNAVVKETIRNTIHLTLLYEKIEPQADVKITSKECPGE